MNLEAVLKRLMEQAETDAELREQLENDLEGVLLRETGMSAEELRETSAQLNEEELAAVGGGFGLRFCDKCRQLLLSKDFSGHKCRSAFPVLL